MNKYLKDKDIQKALDTLIRKGPKMTKYLVVVDVSERYEDRRNNVIFFEAGSDREALFKVALAFLFGWDSLKKHSEDTLAKRVESYIEDYFDPEEESDKRAIRRVRRSPVKHFTDNFKMSNGGDGGDYVTLLLNLETQKVISLE